MSKFSKPKPAGAVTQADIERVIQGADAVDGRAEEAANLKPAPQPADQGEVRFTMTLPADMDGRIDRARKRAGGLTRLAWIRLAVAEKLERDGI